ncbi:hypothetical protein TNCV_1926711 [Trichonephila clavipes]|nr:hypothetical protein TNCV_1926711 [Trichonephila clavipes]
MQVTVRFFARFHPNLEGEKPGGGQGLPTSLPLPPTTREGLRLDGYLDYPHAAKHYTFTQTSMSSPGFKPSSYGIVVSVSNHYTGWATRVLVVDVCGVYGKRSEHCFQMSTSKSEFYNFFY